jgi:valyl-tRNA synthetase
MLADFPKGDPALVDETAESEMGAVIELIKKVRNIRAEMHISTSVKFAVHVAATPAIQRVLKANEAQILKLARAEAIILADTLNVPKASAKAVLTGNATVAIPLEGLIDFEQERERLSVQITKLSTELERLTTQLSNSSFVERAPAEKVAELRERETELTSQIKTLRENLDALG